MLKILSKINPVAKAVGTIGVVAGLVSAVTFAALTSSTVALTNNNMGSATATLAIGAGTSCPDGNTTSTQGFNNVKLVPGQATDPVNFCLDNIGDIPLNITASIPEDLGGNSLDWNKVTLDFACGAGGTISATVAELHAAAQSFTGNPLNPADTPWNCQVTATADADVTGGNLSTFTINFTGTQLAI